MYFLVCFHAWLSNVQYGINSCNNIPIIRFGFDILLLYSCRMLFRVK